MYSLSLHLSLSFGKVELPFKAQRQKFRDETPGRAPPPQRELLREIKIHEFQGVFLIAMKSLSPPGNFPLEIKSMLRGGTKDGARANTRKNFCYFNQRNPLKCTRARASAGDDATCALSTLLRQIRFRLSASLMYARQTPQRREGERARATCRFIGAPSVRQTACIEEERGELLSLSVSCYCAHDFSLCSRTTRARSDRLIEACDVCGYKV